MNMKHSYIQIQSLIGTEIDYLDASIRYFCDDENGNEIELLTQVKHESKAEPYALPYIYDQPSDMYSKLIRAALICAARCCSDIYEFQQE
jgi:histidinol phosphatase-like PHP family hydrolase